MYLFIFLFIYFFYRDNALEEKLPKEKLVLMCQCKNIQEYIKSYDHVLYQGLVEVLIPDVLRPIPSESTK